MSCDLTIRFKLRDVAAHSPPTSDPTCRDEADDAFEVPLAFLMAPQNHKRESRDWNGFTLSLYAMQFGGRNIWGATAGILRNLYERLYRE